VSDQHRTIDAGESRQFMPRLASPGRYRYLNDGPEGWLDIGRFGKAPVRLTPPTDLDDQTVAIAGLGVGSEHYFVIPSPVVPGEMIPAVVRHVLTHFERDGKTTGVLCSVTGAGRDRACPEAAVWIAEWAGQTGHTGG
jgi:hypothetical protein